MFKVHLRDNKPGQKDDDQVHKLGSKPLSVAARIEQLEETLKEYK
jgi:hypothetical protein